LVISIPYDKFLIRPRAQAFKNNEICEFACVFCCLNAIVNIYMLSALQQRDDEIREPGTGGGLLRSVPRNVVQSIRAFRVTELQSEALRLSHHFLYANCSQAETRQQVLAAIAESFHVPRPYGKNFDTLRECLTDLMQKSGQQQGFLIVLEQLPTTQKFDREARENLLDVFRDAADFWADKKIPFRVFFSFQ
jgi:hypothetical protein